MLPTHACRYCGRQIAMVQTRNGRPMPVDPTPNDDGNVIVEWREGHAPIATVLGKSGPVPIGTLFMPHFATCPKYSTTKRRRR